MPSLAPSLSDVDNENFYQTTPYSLYDVCHYYAPPKRQHTKSNVEATLESLRQNVNDSSRRQDIVDSILRLNINDFPIRQRSEARRCQSIANTVPPRKFGIVTSAHSRSHSMAATEAPFHQHLLRKAIDNANNGEKKQTVSVDSETLQEDDESPKIRRHTTPEKSLQKYERFQSVNKCISEHSFEESTLNSQLFCFNATIIQVSQHAAPDDYV